MPNVSLKLVVEPGAMVKPVALVSVSHTVASGLRKVRWNGILETSTRRPEVVMVSVLPSTTVIEGSTQFLMTVKEAFVLKATPLGSRRTRATFASTRFNFTTAVAQVNVSSFSELLNQETTLPGSAILMAGRPRRKAKESVVARFTGVHFARETSNNQGWSGTQVKR